MIQILKWVTVSFALALTVLVSGCQSYKEKDQTSAGTKTEMELEMCVDPRPEICTMEYAPVCGVRDDGNGESFPNGCGACSNQEIVGYQPGECSE